MDKIFSARVDETLVRQIGAMAHELRTTKKAIVEAAIRAYAKTIAEKKHTDVLEQTLGAWQRKEAPEQTVERSRAAFRKAMQRRHP